MESFIRGTTIGIGVGQDYDSPDDVVSHTGRVGYERKISAADWSEAKKLGRVRLGRNTSNGIANYCAAFETSNDGPIIVTNCHNIFVTFRAEELIVDEGTIYVSFKTYEGRD